MNEILKDKRIKNHQAIKIKKQKIEIEQLKGEIEILQQEIYFLNNCKIRPIKRKTKLRVKDILELYPISRSAVWAFAKDGLITPIKVSPKITVFDANEINTFFRGIGRPAYHTEDLTEDIATLKKRGYACPNSPLKSKKN